MSVEAGSCFTCNNQFPLKLLQAGHFIDGRHNAVLFSEQGVHAQCYACNVRKHGNKIKYWQQMESRYGRAVIDKLITQSEISIKYSKIDYENLKLKYEQKLQRLLADPSLAKLNTPITDF
jgi:hypothetical protein